VTYQPPVIEDRLDPWGRPDNYSPPPVLGMSPSPNTKPRHPWAPGVTVGLVVTALIGASFLTGLPATSASGVTSWLPVDGQRVLFAQPGSPGGKFAEWSRPAIYSLIQSDLLAFPLWEKKTGADASTEFLRLHTIQADANGASTGLSDRLWTVEPAGLRTAIDVDISDDGESVNMYVGVMVPGRLDLPSDATPGDTWTSTGSVWTWDAESGNFLEVPYSAQFEATAAADAALPAGCLDVLMHEQVSSLTNTELRTWCPASGVVGFADTTGVWAASADIPAAKVDTEDVFDWGKADSLDFSPLAVNQGGDSLILSPVSPPGLLQGGALFAGKLQPDLLAISTDKAMPKVVWAARPGGALTASATLRGISMVATTQRLIVAYNNEGRWLWQTTLPDVSSVPPVLFGDRVVVAALDGSVTALDPATGAPAWTTNLGAEIRIKPISSGERLLVADQAGVLTCLDGDGNTVWAKEAGVPESLAVSGGAEPVIVYGESGSAVLKAYSLADGHQVWRSRVFKTPTDLIALNSVVVMRDNSAVLGIDWQTGSVLWRWTSQVTAAGIGGGDRVLLLTETELVLLAGDGTEVKTWPHQLGHVTGTTPYLVTTQGAVLAYGEHGAEIGVTS